MQRLWQQSLRASVMAWLLICTPTAWSDEALIAVATNFKVVAERLLQQFHEQQPTHRLRLVSASTGKLYAQILNGAPFDLFLAADAQRPQRLEQQGLTVTESRHTYALGQLALLGQQPVMADTLFTTTIHSLAMANPNLAPYGLAAQQTLGHLNVQLQPSTKVVLADNIGQVYAMVATGNAQLGFVALANLSEPDKMRAWLVPTEYHQPIAQQLVLMHRAADNSAALAFLAFMQTSTTVDTIKSFGYQVNPND